MTRAGVATRRWCDVALAGVAGVGVVAGLLCYRSLSASQFGPLGLQVFAVFYLPALGLVTRAGAGLSARVGRVIAVALSIVAAAVFLEAAEPIGVLPVLVMALLWCYAERRRPLFAVGLLTVGMAIVLVGCGLSPQRMWYGVIPAQLALVLAGAVLLHGRSARETVSRRGPDGVVLAEGLLGRLRRVFMAASLAVGVLLVALLALRLQIETIAEHRLALGEASRLGGDDASARDEAGGLDGDLSQALPHELGSGQRSDAEDVRLLLVRVRDPNAGGWLTDGRPFLLRAGYLDQIAAERLFARRGPTDRHAVPVGARWLPLDDVAGDLEIHIEEQSPVPYLGDDTVLLGVAPWRALRISSPVPAGNSVMERGPGIYTLVRSPPALDYAVATDRGRFAHARVLGDRNLSVLRGRRAWASDPSQSMLPDDMARREDLDRRARAIVGAEQDDLARVEAVVAYLRDGFAYNLDAPFRGGFAAVDDLFESGEGICSHFAAAAVGLLRSIGVPARVGTGFLCQDYDRDTRAYGVWSSNRHAWLEVAFEGYGWVPFDVTPPASLERLIAARGPEPMDDVEGPAVATPTTLVAMLDEIVTAPRRALDAMAGLRSEWWWGAGVVLLALALLRGRRRASLDGRRPVGLIGADAARYERLHGALERLGFRRGRSRTAREFAHEVWSHGGDAYDELPAVMRLFDRARFGRRPLGDAELSRVDRLIDRIEAINRPEDRGSPG